uniref:Mediator of RNA polymerase II transcription subunit 16 n=1 Tax=Oryza punctata TaxID=4537 RepID=A0A0E0M9B0_ORYPU
MTSSSAPNPSPLVPTPTPTPTPSPPATATAAGAVPVSSPPPPPPKDQQQEGGGGVGDGGGGGGGVEEVGVGGGEAMEVDGGGGGGGVGDVEGGGGGGGAGGGGGGGQQPSPATVFRIRLKQPPSSLRHKMRVPELCRNFSAVAWCGKLNAIACASETCARIPSSNSSPPFWIPIHILNPERPTECSVFNVKADSPRDFVQFIEWSPRSCPRALLVANFHGRITIWTQPTKGPINLVRDASSWQCEHEWRQDLSVVTNIDGFLQTLVLRQTQKPLRKSSLPNSLKVQLDGQTFYVSVQFFHRVLFSFIGHSGLLKTQHNLDGFLLAKGF